MAKNIAIAALVVLLAVAVFIPPGERPRLSFESPDPEIPQRVRGGYVLRSVAIGEDGVLWVTYSPAERQPSPIAAPVLPGP